MYSTRCQHSEDSISSARFLLCISRTENKIDFALVNSWIHLLAPTQPVGYYVAAVTVLVLRKICRAIEPYRRLRASPRRPHHPICLPRTGRNCSLFTRHREDGCNHLSHIFGTFLRIDILLWIIHVIHHRIAKGQTCSVAWLLQLFILWKFLTISISANKSSLNDSKYPLKFLDRCNTLSVCARPVKIQSVKN